MSTEDTMQCLTSTATSLDDDNPNYIDELGVGMIDAFAFVSCMGVNATSAPTGTPTTALPTTSAMPTPDCVCEYEAQLTIFTDAYPGETTWEIESNDDRCGAYFEEGGPYDSSDRRTLARFQAYVRTHHTSLRYSTLGVMVFVAVMGMGSMSSFKAQLLLPVTNLMHPRAQVSPL